MLLLGGFCMLSLILYYDSTVVLPPQEDTVSYSQNSSLAQPFLLLQTLEVLKEVLMDSAKAWSEILHKQLEIARRGVHLSKIEQMYLSVQELDLLITVLHRVLLLGQKTWF